MNEQATRSLKKDEHVFFIKKNPYQDHWNIAWLSFFI
jgi:hypothetical protein